MLVYTDKLFKRSKFFRDSPVQCVSGPAKCVYVKQRQRLFLITVNTKSCWTRQTYLFEPYVVLVGQYVQSFLALRFSFLNSLARRVRVVAFGTSLHPAPFPLLQASPHLKPKFCLSFTTAHYCLTVFCFKNPRNPL